MDKYLRYALEVLFHRTSPKHVMNTFLSNSKPESYFMSALNKSFELRMRMEYGFLSIDEIHNAAIALEKSFKEDKYKYCGVFTAIFKFANSTLWEQNGQPCVKFVQLLRFRDTVHTIGAEIFICAFLAELDYCKHNRKREDFSYPTSIPTDNTRLQNMLKEGLAENHFHLKGSTPSFMLSWICLMNNVKNRKKVFDSKLKNKLLNSDMLFIDMNDNESYYSLVMKAARIRLFLTKILKKEYSEEEMQEKDREIRKFLCFDDKTVSANLIPVQTAINTHKKYYSFKLDGYKEYIDYAIENKYAENKSNLVFTGERKLLYDMFYAIISNDSHVRPYIDLFYTYILISTWFRGELVQNNDRAGFANFNEYQDRKGYFLEGYRAYENALIAIALESNLEKPYVRSIETRFVPKAGSKNISSQVAFFDSMAQISKKEEITGHSRKSDESENPKRHFYVAHFPKDVDNKYQPLRCRHHELRRYVKNSSLSIANIRNKQDEASYRILGIDACANEIGCRPEVFAQAFRFLKNHHVKGSTFINRKFPQQLKITYHAGEDFLDVADGLRAINEAIYFLNMTSGDRLGHALALGIDAEKWYSSKNNRIILPRQDLLDNSAWLIHKLSEYGYSNIPFIYELKSIYKENFLYVYQQKMPFQEKDRFIDDSIYTDSWSLRGDDPYLYRDCIDPKKYLYKIQTGYLYPNYEYNLYAKNFPENDKLSAIRESNISAYKLMNYYHFDMDVRRLGNECVEYEISRQYINAVSYIQEQMRYDLAQKGIGIECNPSSNYLIGTFKRYDQHPIINFNNRGLCVDCNNAKMFISINTDDLGVFDTSLENEYALLACALQKAENTDGNKKYSPNDIYDYLDYVRKMGMEQSFLRE